MIGFWRCSHAPSRVSIVGSPVYNPIRVFVNSGPFHTEGFAMKTRTRPAFTLIELLVVFALLAFAIGLLLPLIQRIRMTAARMESQNHLKHLGIGCHAFHDAHKKFTSGV